MQVRGQIKPLKGSELLEREEAVAVCLFRRIYLYFIASVCDDIAER